MWWSADCHLPQGRRPAHLLQQSGSRDYPNPGNCIAAPRQNHSQHVRVISQPRAVHHRSVSTEPAARRIASPAPNRQMVCLTGRLGTPAAGATQHQMNALRNNWLQLMTRFLIKSSSRRIASSCTSLCLGKCCWVKCLCSALWVRAAAAVPSQ